MDLVIANVAQLDVWMRERKALGHNLEAIKGDPPEGATYSFGGLIKLPVNVAWRDCDTGEVFKVEYLPRRNQR